MKTEQKEPSNVGMGKMIRKTMKLWVRSILHFRFSWYYPGIPEITPQEVFEKLQSDQKPYLIDVRDSEDISKTGLIEEAVIYPYFDFLNNIDNIPRDANSYVTICPGGGASLVVAEILIEQGFENVFSMKGGSKKWKKNGLPLTKISKEKVKTLQKNQADEVNQILEGKEADIEVHIDQTIDARFKSCPYPVLQGKKTINNMEIGQVVKILATDPGSLRDIPSWAKNTKQEFISYQEVQNGDTTEYHFLVRKLK